MPSIILAARGRITTYFREDIGRGFPHNGVDQGHGDGTREDLRIKAPADGIVIAHGPLGSYGKRLVIRHPDGWTSLLAHHANQYVTTGDRVFQGGDIAEMGNTGTIFVHNHQELRDANGNQVDPLLNLGTSTASGFMAALPKLIQGEDDMLVARKTSTGDTFTLGPHFVKHETDYASAQYSANVFTADDAILQLDDNQFNTILDSLGIPRTQPTRLAAEDRGGVWAPALEILNLLHK